MFAMQEYIFKINVLDYIHLSELFVHQWEETTIHWFQFHGTPTNSAL